MCGIFGIVRPAGVTGETLKTMAGVLCHRGPDDEGFYVTGAAGLGHRRLSIIDVEGGRQPMANEDGTLWIVFNGEIYNYQDLRRGMRETHVFATDSDTEVMLHLYEEEGEAFVKKLRGMFAFAIWDTRRQRLFLGRDHLGQKPLFYAQTHKGFAFASEIKALLAIDPSLRALDPHGLHQYLTLRLIAPPLTMFAGIQKLPPGHTLALEAGGIKIERYWRLRYEPKISLSEAEILDELDRRVEEAVRYAMVSDVPVGAFLSGGMDSSLIVAMMSKISSQPVKTFSVGVPYRNTSELPYARRLAEAYGTDHHEETIVPSLVRILPDLVWHLDEPADPLSAPMYEIARMARREVKVVLGGDGGDELFGGYDRYYGNRYADLYAHLPVAFRRQVMAGLLRRMPDGFWYKSLSHQIKWLNHLSFEEGGSRYARSLSYFFFTGEARQELYGERMALAITGFDPEEVIAAAFSSADARDPIDKMLSADSMVRLPDHSVMILDRTTMAHGLEVRSPFMDHELVEFMARVPAALKVRGRTLRYLQARLAERYLPPELLRRRKQGFSSSLPYLLAQEFRLLFELFLSDSHLARDGFLKQEPIGVLVAEHLQRGVDHGNRLWLLCNAEIWYRMAIEGCSRQEIKERLAGSRMAEVAHAGR